MRHWINIFSPALLESKASFRLHPSLDPEKYQITNTLREVKKWRAYAYEDLTMMDPKNSIRKGEMVEVGYVMISRTDDTIIPISRADEHHRGYDLLYDLKGVNPEDYIPVWVGGNNYLYSKKDVADFLPIAKKYLAYGGPDCVIKGTSELNGKITMMSEFVARNGDFDIEPGTLAPLGAMILNNLKSLAETFRSCRTMDSRAGANKALRAAQKYVRENRQHLLYYKVESEHYEVFTNPAILKNAMATNDPIQAMEEIFFGPTGFKNAMHNVLREFLRRQVEGEVNVWKDDDIVGTWGDVELAVDMLGRI